MPPEARIDAAVAAATKAATAAATPRRPPDIRRRRSVSVAEDPAVWDVDEYDASPAFAAVDLDAPRWQSPEARPPARPAWR